MKTMGKTLSAIIVTLTLASCGAPKAPMQCDINSDGIEDITITDTVNNKKYIKLSGPRGTYEICKVHEMIPGINWIYSKNDKGYYDIETKRFKPAEDPETQKPIPLY